jgi:hypothetical protein
MVMAHVVAGHNKLDFPSRCKETRTVKLQKWDKLGHSRPLGGGLMVDGHAILPVVQRQDS